MPPRSGPSAVSAMHGLRHPIIIIARRPRPGARRRRYANRVHHGNVAGLTPAAKRAAASGSCAPYAETGADQTAARSSAAWRSLTASPRWNIKTAWVHTLCEAAAVADDEHLGAVTEAARSLRADGRAGEMVETMRGVDHTSPLASWSATISTDLPAKSTSWNVSSAHLPSRRTPAAILYGTPTA